MTSPTKVPALRIRAANDAPVAPRAGFVLYLMTAFRRTRSNFALQRALEWAQELDRPLVVLEALRCDYRWASDRLHRFVLEGMAGNARRFAGTPVLYHPYVEPTKGAGKGLVAALAARAAVVIADDYPCFFLPRMLAAAARQSPVRCEAVDSNGLLPLAATDRDFPTAHAFRRHLQKTLPDHLGQLPAANPLARLRLPEATSLPRDIVRRWPATPVEALTGDALLRSLPIDHAVAPVAASGGEEAARRALQAFVHDRLAAYAESRNDPGKNAASGLSPWLHFGHLSAHDVLRAVADHEDWDPGRLGSDRRGSRSGWWRMSEAAEAFLDELVTWRELGYVFCRHRPDYARFESLPPWARQTLTEHAQDPRPHLYPLPALEAARTHDPLWNAAQRQLVREGIIHNYLRMLWGKKILEWSRTPRHALEAMIELNNKYALDGRDPNSYSGIFWVLGRFDRAWGPERPIFGKIRYMSSENTARKIDTKAYLARYADRT